MWLPLLLTLAALPVPRSAADVETQLALGDATRAEALENVSKACRGSLRLVLRDHAAIVKSVSAAALAGPEPQRRAAITALRCFRPAVLEPTFRALLDDADPGLVAYALEIASNTRDVGLAGAVLDHAAKVQPTCTAPDGPTGAALEACVWAIYAPSTLLGGADRATRERAGQLASAWLAAPAPKQREVAVETLLATHLRAMAPAVATLLERERKKGGFAEPNAPALLTRFAAHKRALESAEP